MSSEENYFCIWSVFTSANDYPDKRQDGKTKIVGTKGLTNNLYSLIQ